MSKSQKSVSQSATSPWSPAQGHLTNILNSSGKLAKQDELFAPVRGDTTQQALDQMQAIGEQGSLAQAPLTGVIGGATEHFDLGMGQLAATARGDYLGGNPHLQGLLDTIANDTANDVNGQFSAAGRYGSGAHSGTLGKAIGTVRARAMLDDYNIERRNQLAAADQLRGAGFQGAQIAPMLDQANLYGTQLLGQVGQADDAHTMGALQAPLKALEWQSGMTVPIASLGSQSSSYSKTKSSDPMSQIAGGAMMAAGLMTGNPAMAMGGMGNLSGGSSPFGANPWAATVTRA